MTSAGQLDRRVQFRRSQASDDGFATVETFADHGNPVWASRRDVSDRERQLSGQIGALLVTRFVVRWSDFSSDITPKDRMTSEGREFDILGIKEQGRRSFLEITAQARADR